MVRRSSRAARACYETDTSWGLTPGSTTIDYSDTEAATTAFAVVELVKSGKTTHKVRIGTHDLNGPDSLAFPSRVGGHALAKGRYELEAAPTLGSFKGKTVVAPFTVT